MPGQIVILNGAPRSGKSSIAAAIRHSFDGTWVNLGVDVTLRHMTPAHLQPGIGLRPGGERPDLEDFVVASYAALYDSIAAYGRSGLNVVVDVGHHDSYSKPLGILPDCARRLADIPVLFVGVRCPIETIMARRDASEDRYAKATPEDPIPAPVRLWQTAVHEPGIYDLEVDTSRLTPEECAAEVQRALDTEIARPTAFERLARES